MTAAKPAVQTFGKYQILERIATGGMAEIYKARLEGIGGFQRIFAIKRILPHLSQNADYVAMLVDEAKVAGLLSHANIVQILDLGQVDGVWFIAMEHVEGRDLGRILKRAREKGLSLPLPHTVYTALELLKGLEYAHQRQVMRGGRPVPLNIIHRDVSPPNILLSFQGEVKLTDFGIARASHKALETQSGIIKGRFDYMSPEQAAGAKDLDQRSDLFSVGVVLYEMLTGQHPFRAESEFTTLDRIRTGRYEPISNVNPSVPFTLETIVDRALRVDRGERYPSATAMKEALDKFFHDSGFLFTQSTLAAYVKGLFPDAFGGPAPTPPEEEPDLPDDVELGFDNDAPTRVTGKPDLTPPPLDAKRAAAFGAKPESEDPTLIRNSRFLQDAFGADWADEQETVIKPSPFTPAPPDGGVSETSLDQDTGTPIIDERSTPELRPRVTRRVLIGPVGWLLAPATLLVGLVVGGTLGAVGLHLLRGPPPAPSLPDPVVQLRGPEGTALRLNGVPVVGDRTLPAGQTVRVQVVREGLAPYEEELALGAGEIHRFVVLPHEPEEPVP